LEVRVESVRQRAAAIRAYELRPVGGGSLPPFTAGSHIDLCLPNGLVRAYSLCNAQSEVHRYVIAVSLDRSSAGGSRFMHEHVRGGDTLQVSSPRNNFPLYEGTAHSVLIAGGVGITPVWCMVQRLIELGSSWELHYCARTRRDAIFVEELEELTALRSCLVHLHFDDERGGRLLDVGSVVASAPRDSHLYCCGPAGLLRAFEAASTGLSSEHVHVEYFEARESAAISGGFVVVLARSGRRIEVKQGKTILQAILEADIHVPHSCTEGTCGSCETAVIRGTPDHRDSVLSQAERARNETMMICCSGCIGDELVLDL